ncbi:MAG: hypothetical protein HY719_01790 [Planctomycetes bacterium]|nr:hypothetical protein [Planctomycetota bacterium]
MMEKFKWLAAVIAAHPGQKVVGRTRLQKTVKILQRLGAPMDYCYTLHFYGPYSEGVHFDIGLLEAFGLVEEEKKNRRLQDGSSYFVLKATEPARKLAERPEVKKFQPEIKTMNNTGSVALELAATYDAFREMGDDHDTALQRLRRKKGDKCTNRHVKEALALLKKLGLAGS